LNGSVTRFRYVDGEVHGEALKTCVDGTIMWWNYVNGVEHGPGKTRAVSGRCTYFFKKDGQTTVVPKRAYRLILQRWEGSIIN
jgi:hypothetical protein